MFPYIKPKEVYNILSAVWKYLKVSNVVSFSLRQILLLDNMIRITGRVCYFFSLRFIFAGRLVLVFIYTHAQLRILKFQFSVLEIIEVPTTHVSDMENHDSVAFPNNTFQEYEFK